MVNYITELFYDGQWNAITSDVRNSDAIVMNRGRRDWATVSDPSTLSLKLNNGPSKVSPGVFGRYSPRNPRSDLFGKIGRNTPIRVRNETRQNDSVYIPDQEESIITAPDTASFAITGDIDLRVDVKPFDWRLLSDQSQGLNTMLNQDQAWAFSLVQDGTLQFLSTPDGIFGNAIISTSTEKVPEGNDRLAVRVTLDADDGSGNNVVTFYTADTIDGPWTQLGDAVTNSGTTSIFDSGETIDIGGLTNSKGLPGDYFAVEIRDGIDGTEVGNPDFSGHEPEDRTIEDAAGNTWTLNGNATFTDDAIRFAGEAKSWPQEWDLSGNDQWVNLSAAGVTRRLQQGAKPLKSSLFRDLSIKDGIVAYWPMEEPDGSDRFRAGRADDDSVLFPIQTADVTFAGDSETFFASEPLPTFNEGPVNGRIPAYSGADDQRFFFLISVPESGFSSNTRVLELRTTGSIDTWQIEITAGDGTNLDAFSAGASVESAASTMNWFGVPAVMSLWLQQDGSDVTWQVAKFPLDGSGATVFGDTIAGETYGRFDRLSLGSGADMVGTTFGHVAILNDDVQTIWDTVGNSLQGWTGETGVERLTRLAGDEGIGPVLVEGEEESEAMGPQLLKSLVDLLREVPAADLGLLNDRQDANGLEYRTRVGLYSQTPKLTLDYSNGVIAAPFTPVDDDQSVRNDVTVTRVRGGKFNAVQESGTLSVQSPPDGVGKYDVSQEINIDSDDRLEDQAFWRLHLGTIDEFRFPNLRLNLRNAQVAALIDDVLSVKLGDLIQIDNPPEWLPGGPYLLLVESMREEKTAVTHVVEFNCSPGTAWDALMLDDADFARLDTGGSTLTSNITAAQTSFDVTTAAGSQRWLEQDIALVLPGQASSSASTPDTAALDLTGDIEVRAEVSRDSWSNITSEEVMIAKYWDSTDDRSWRFSITPGGFVRFQWTTGGTSGTIESLNSAVPVPLLPGERIALRATLVASTGTVNFAFADSIDGTYTALGAGQTTGSATSIFSGNASLEVGVRDNNSQTPWNGVIYACRVNAYSGAGVVADPDFTAQTEGATSFTDSAGLVWTINGNAVIEPEDPFDIVVGGEVMRVNVIDGDSSPQTFEVERAINGVSAAHAAGTDVRLARPARLSL